MKRRISSFEILKLVESHLPVGIWSFDIDTGELRWSAGFYRLMGVDPTTEAPSMERYAGLVLPSDRREFSETGRILEDRTSIDRKFRIRRPDGAVRWLTCRREAIHDPDGRMAAILGVVADISPQEEMRRALQLSTAGMDALGRLSGAIAVWRNRPDGSAFEAPEWQRLTGQSAAEITGWGRLAAIHPEDREGVRAAWEAALEGGEAYEAHYRIRLREGRYLPVTSRGAALHGPDGEREGWVGVILPRDRAARPGAAAEMRAEQFRAARTLLGWTAQDLADAAGLSLSTIRRLEDGGSGAVAAQSIEAARRTLEERGLQFLSDPDGSFGVMVRRRGTEAAAGR